MKIRIRGNSVRYRLTKSEVAIFSETGSYIEKTEFSTNIFLYILQAKEGIENLEADFFNNSITLFFPKKDLAHWANSDKVGFSHSYVMESGKSIALLVEKDFVCMDETVEDQSDNYPNPKAK